MQALSVLPSFYSQESFEHDKILPLSRAVDLNMSLLKRKTSPIDLKRKTSPIDPTNFLWALRNKITRNRGSLFNFNSQQDVPEILQIVIDELKGISQLEDIIISSTLQTSVTCNVCLYCNIQEEKFDMITLPLTSSVSEFIKKFLEHEELTGAKRWFCPSCNDLTYSTKEIKFIKVRTIVISSCSVT